MAKVGLVLEGGALRGLFTAGVLDVFLDHKIDIDTIIGVSAGALFGANYFSEQKGRAIRYSKKYAKDLRYISVLSYLLTGNVVNKSFAYYKVSKYLDPFDNDKFMKNNKNFYAVVTNLNTGLAEYQKINDCFLNMEILRASSAIPLYTKPITINSSKYLDGAVGDSVPIRKMQELGFEKIIVVLTRPKDYRKEELTDSEKNKIYRKYKKYPKFAEAMINRPKVYNETMDYIDELEKQNKIFVIRPNKLPKMKLIERDIKKLDNLYNIGVQEANDKIEDLKLYIR